MRAALVQLSSTDDPDANLAPLRAAVKAAAGQGAELILTPEVTNCVSQSRARQREVLRREEEDATLAAMREMASAHGVWIALGSIAVLTDDAEGRFANRSLLIGPDGGVAARYDKIHMFDVQVSEEETYRESAGYRPGTRAVVADACGMRIGLTICYDVRFAHLYRDLAKSGAQILAVPSAFSTATGPMHWESLLRARAIETGCYVLAAAQCGTHAASRGKPRRTHGHSLAVSPWGEVLADGGSEPGVTIVDIDPAAVADARARVPSLSHDRPYDGP